LRIIDGEPVTDAVNRIRVDVTADDIRRGEPLNPNSCAIARACMRQLPRVVAAKVHKGRLYLKMEGQKQWRRWSVPEYATREIVAYDRGGKMIPQRMDFDPPPIKVLPMYRKGNNPRKANKHRTGRAFSRTVHRTLEVRDEARKNEGE
jgi:hypothetical protein